MKSALKSFPLASFFPRVAVTTSFTVLFAMAFCGKGNSQTPTGGNAPRVTPNRTLPNVSPPQSGLVFSDDPTPQDFFRARVFEEPLVPIGGEPSRAENSALAAALLGYAKRSGTDDFSSLTDFLQAHPQSPWRAALLTDLGLEYYNTAHYSLALEAWAEAWALAKAATDGRGKAIADRAVGELAFMYARLGRMNELEALLKSVEGRCFIGPATGKITGAREGLWSMQNQPGVSFRCGPLALRCIQVSLNPKTPLPAEVLNSASTQQGFSLSQVVELSRKVGLNYQMAFRGAPLTPSLSPSDGERVSAGRVRGEFIVPSVVHWKVGHYAALVRKEGNLYLLQDPTFGNETWATREALEAESSGYFLIPPGDLPRGWRAVDAKEGASVWGKGQTSGNDPKNTTPNDPKTPDNPCKGMAVSSVHLMTVNLNLADEPVGYSPPVGPPVKFIVRYNHREAFQPGSFNYSNFGPKWTCDWISYITDNPSNTLADVNQYVMGGGTRTFTGFNTNAQTYGFQQYDQTQVARTGPASYEMTSPDGSKMIFSQSDGTIGTSRKIFLTQILDPFGNAVTLTYDANLRIVALTDAIGQVTTLTYSNAADIYKITKVTDPFGRIATFDYDASGRLIKITDVIGLTSQFVYQGGGDFIQALVTPYGTNTFSQETVSGNTRFLETTYPDGSRERVEYSQTNNVPLSDPVPDLPLGMSTHNDFLRYRNTYYWSRTACALGYGDISKARLYHWLHTESLSTTAGALESAKAPLEGRVWYDYAGQSDPVVISPSTQPAHVGRVLDDGSTQLYTYAYDGFGHVTNRIDPVGRTFSYIYATNGIDLLEVRMTRAGKNELQFQATYNSQHLPLTKTDAAGQTTTFTYNARGQVLTETNPKNETTTFTYDTNGYLVRVDGPLSGTNDVVTATYDAFGRTRTRTDVSGYTLTFDYDALDRLTQIIFPDSSFAHYTYDRLDLAVVRDRAGLQTAFEYDRVRQMTKRTDPLGRATLFQWCQCGDLKSLIDPMGRVTAWQSDIQGRVTSKQYADGSKGNYSYETTTSRLREVVDEKMQLTTLAFNRDDTLKSTAHANAVIPTPGVSYTYDTDYERVTSMTDGLGTTHYAYVPITSTPVLGAGQLASVDGPLPNDTITYIYDELGRSVQRSINGIAATKTFDAAGRVTSETNALGSFSYGYDGSSFRMTAATFPNGQTAAWSYMDHLHDDALQQITYAVGATPVSQFSYGRDALTGRITTWSQQAGAETPLLHTMGYDASDQLLSVTVSNAATLINTYAYAYDPAGNRLADAGGGVTNTAVYNSLNQVSATTGSGLFRTNEWDANDRLVAVSAGNQRTELAYDGLGRLASIRRLLNGSEQSLRRFLWCDNELCEERNGGGAVTKRFFKEGMTVQAGPATGAFYYTRDHLGSIREVTDSAGVVRARYGYDPYGRRTRLAGDMDADFGFAGMFSASEAALDVTRFRAYDPELGRWLSRDPLDKAEFTEGPNLYAYVGNDPLNHVDPLGLECCEPEVDNLKHAIKNLEDPQSEAVCNKFKQLAAFICKEAYKGQNKKSADKACGKANNDALDQCAKPEEEFEKALRDLEQCRKAKCKKIHHCLWHEGEPYEYDTYEDKK